MIFFSARCSLTFTSNQCRVLVNIFFLKFRHRERKGGSFSNSGDTHCLDFNLNCFQQRTIYGIKRKVRDWVSSLFLFLGTYVNRVTYTADATIMLQALTIKDEGWYSISVDFQDGATMYNKVFLQITCKKKEGLP